MSIKHPLTETIEDCPYRIILPVSAESRLKTGLFQRLVRKDEAYRTLAKEWADLDAKGHNRGTMAKDSKYFWKKAPPIVIVPVKLKPFDIPIVDTSSLAGYLATMCKHFGVRDVAVSRSTWLNMRYRLEQFLELVDGLEAHGIVVHEYE